MEDKRDIKVVFSITAQTIVEDTKDKDKGEASTGYEYKINTSLPELAFSIAQFLKIIDSNKDMQAGVANNGPVGLAVLTLIEQYYKTKEE